MNCDNTALCELMALSFAITELGLYLDTHQNDKEPWPCTQTMSALPRRAKSATRRPTAPSSRPP